jgi:uncharacterized protein (TIGR02118 family)
MARTTVKLLVLYGRPVEDERFDRHFEQIHLPLLSRLPNLEAVQINADSAEFGADAPFHRVVELQFATEELMQEGLNSELGQLMARDLGSFASGGVSVLRMDEYR